MKVFTSCRTGSKHISAGTPCQDRFRTLTKGDRQIFIISDGHGNRVHCRAIPAALIACSAAAKALSDPATPLDQIPEAIKTIFDKKMAMHMRQHPFHFQERQLLYGRKPACAYGATLLCCMVWPGGTFMLRLGDGEIHAVKADGTFFPATKGELVSSMYSTDAVQNMETAFFPEPAAAVMLFSDGFRNPEEHPTPLIRQLIDPDGACISQAALQAGACGDDQTVILAMDEQAVAAPAFSAGIQQYLRHTEAQAQVAQIDEALLRVKATADGLIRKLHAIGTQVEDWDRVFSQLLQDGHEYTALMERRNNLLKEGD